MTGSLVEKLGHGAETRLLIVNCDDLGSSHSANVATLRAMAEGIATSATLMVPCPWAREAAEMFKGRDIGVHLTLTAEYPGYRWRSLTGAASLHDGDGFLPATMKAAVAKATPEDVRAECIAQIEMALSWGVDITHLDNHMGTLHFHPPFFEIYLDLAAEYRLPVRNFSVRRIGGRDFATRELAAGRGILINDHIVNAWPGVTRDVFAETFRKLAPGVTEVFGHPVEDGPELRGYDPEHPHVRAHDAEALVDTGLKRLIADEGIVPISYRPIRELMRRL